jgi:diamine N-acetyltransferase
VTAVTVDLREITGDNRDAVLALRVAPGQERFVSSVADSLREADRHPEAKPWYRAAYDGDTPVGFVMLSWDLVPDPPTLLGPWFLWKLIIDARRQGRGYGREILRLVTDLVRAEGATELLTSHVAGDGGPAGFYARLGFTPTGAVDPEGEIILRLAL